MDYGTKYMTAAGYVIMICVDNSRSHLDFTCHCWLSCFQFKRRKQNFCSINLMNRKYGFVAKYTQFFVLPDERPMQIGRVMRFAAHVA